MSAIVQVGIHPSQSPQNVRRELLNSLLSRKIAHKFHYDSVKQTQKWLTLHQRYSPSRHDADCRMIYEESFKAAVAKIRTERVYLIGLGCGGGQKDTRFLKLLEQAGKKTFYTPSDVSVAMVLTARETALCVIAAKNCFPLVCDLGAVTDGPAIFDAPVVRRASRVITFFGMIPNFEPQEILPKLASLVRRGDSLLFSANLAPGNDYAAGVKKVLPQYDNPATRDWLMTFLLDLGVEKSDGELRFEIENRQGLKRIVARFHFKRSRWIEIEDQLFAFAPREKVRLFFSYRYTPERIRKVLAAHKLQVCEQWIAKSGEEGVFLCRKV